MPEYLIQIRNGNLLEVIHKLPTLGDCLNFLNFDEYIHGDKIYFHNGFCLVICGSRTYQIELEP